jgi:predicted dehydrogenase
MPEWVKATVIKQRPNATVDDFFSIQLGYKSMVADLKAGYVVPFNDLKYVVHGTKGSYVKMGMDIQESQLQKGMLPQDSGYGIEPENQTGTIILPSKERIHQKQSAGNYHMFYNQLFRSITHGEVAPVSEAEILNVIELIEAVYKSAKDGITIPITHSTGRG